MTYTLGFIKLHRNIKIWEWYDDPNTLATWVHILMNANWEDAKMWRGQTIEQGAFITSLSKLSTEIGISVKQLRLCLSRLKEGKRIIVEGTSQWTKVIVCNYADYMESGEPSGQAKGTRRAHEGQAEGKQRATTKEDKEYKENKEIKNKEDIVTYDEAVDRLYNLYPSSTTRTEGSRVTLRSQKDKKKLATMLKNGETEENISYMITRYVGETDPRFLKMLSTLLNNPPDYSNRELDFSATTDDSSNWLNGRKPQE